MTVSTKRSRPILFRLDGIHNRTTREWNGNGASWRTNMRHHAQEHGAAGAWRADDSFVMFYRDGGKIRQKTWAHGRPHDLHKSS